MERLKSITIIFLVLFTVSICFLPLGAVRLAAKTQADRDPKINKGKSSEAGTSLIELRRESNKLLRQFGLVLAVYADDHEGDYPDTLDSFFDSIREGTLTYGLSEELARWVNYNVRYFGKGKTIKDSARTAIAYDNSLFEAQASEGTNVLFANGQVKFIKKDQLKKLDGLPQTNLEVLDIKIEPIRQGKNVVHVKVKNDSKQDQMFRIQIYTRSPGVGGWGTSFFDTIKAGKTKWTCHGCKIRGPITDGTYIQLDFRNPAPAASFDREKWRNGERTDWFKSVRYESNDLERCKVDKSQIKPASKSEAQAVIKTLRQIQDHIKNKEYESAWGLFTQDFKEAEFQITGFEKFRKCMETPQMHYFSRMELLALEPKSAKKVNDVFALTTAMKDKLWTVDFVQAGGQYKLDSISGLISSNWQERLLPLLEKHSTKHFDIYYFKDSTAEKEIDQIASRKEKGFQKICRFLGKDFDVRISMVFFEDGKTKQMMTGHQGAGWAFGNTIVEIYNEQQKLDPYHETAHVLMRPYGNPPALFNEGFAVYMSERLGAPALKNLSGGLSSIYGRVKELKNKNEWIPLEELLTYIDIGPKWSRPPVSYAEAGAFVKFLIETYGKDKFLQTYKTLKNSNDKSVQQQNMETLQQIYGQSLQQLEEQWKTAIFSSS